jgi:hypothetical protein
MRIPFYLFFLFIFSCKKRDNPSNNISTIKTVSSQYFIKWNYPYATGNNLLAYSMFSYNSNNPIPIKRSGSYLPVFGGYNYNSYTDQVYDTVIRVSSQKLSLQSKNKLLPGSSNPPRWDVEMTDDKPVKRISYLYYSGNYIPGDTAVYFYDAARRLEKIEFHSSVQGYSYLFTKTFFFNNDNLQKVSGVYLQKPNTVYFTTEETFTSYDNKPNPLKSLWLWDDLYYRSLSSNNFSSYTYKRFDAQNNLTDSTHKTWNLQYDEKGNISFK